jgi:Mor family transcriptional regulator
MSDYHIRNLANACAPRIAAKVEAAILATIRQELPETIAEVLREQHAGGSLSLYVAKRPVAAKRDRNEAICARYNGHNAKSLAAEFRCSVSLIYKIVALRGS